jgi:hypothetical protein
VEGLLNFGDSRSTAGGTPGFLFGVENLIDDEDLIGIGKDEQVRWGSREEPWTLPGPELYGVLCTGSAPDGEVSHARSVRAGHTLSIEKNGKIGTVVRPYDERRESCQVSTSQRDFHGMRLGPDYAGELPQSECLRL